MKKKFLFIFLFLYFSNIFPQDFIGQKFILTLNQDLDFDKISDWLSKTKPAGIMLVPGQFKKRSETKQLIDFLQKKAKELNLPKLFISVDWEGGIVSRPNEQGGFHSIPSPRSLALTEKTYIYLAAKLIGQQMRSVGINMDFAPSLDLFDQENQILATRCFSSEAQTVIDCAIFFTQGLLSENIIPVVKHFPGLGLAKNDTHKLAASLDFDSDLAEKNLAPFKVLLENGVPAIMSTHASCSLFGKTPVTLNNNAVNWIKNINKEVLLITDDFCMKALPENLSLDQASWKAFFVGYDLIIYSANPEEQINLINKLQNSFDDLIDEDKDKILSSVQKINSFKDKYLNSNSECKEFLIDEKKLSKDLAAKSIQTDFTYFKKFPETIYLITVDLPKIRASESWFIDKKISYLGKLLKDKKLDIYEIILDPTDKSSIKTLKEFLTNIDKKQDYKLILQTFFYGQNNYNKIEKDYLEILKNYQDNLILVSLGHPAEHRILSKAKYFNLGSFHKPMLDEAALRLLAKQTYTGAQKFVKNLDLYLKNKKFGLLCHSASIVLGRDNKYKFLPDILFDYAKEQKNKTEMIALFAPEHGLMADFEYGADVPTKNSSKWLCPIYSLHGKTKKPTAEMLKKLDLLVIDLPDVGVRCFTYLSTLKLAIDSARENNIPVILLDNPNPIYFWPSSGPQLDPKLQSFVGLVDEKFIHGKTFGQIAGSVRMDSTSLTTNGDTKNVRPERSPFGRSRMGTNDFVISCSDKKFWPDFFKTHKFFPPSPNLQTLESVYAYPITVFLEGTNYSEGRGTDYPFEQFGAPWVDGKKLAKILNNKKLPGIFFQDITFLPKSISSKATNPKFKDQLCQGVFLHMYDKNIVDPIKTAKTIIEVLFKLYPDNSIFIKSGNNYFIDKLAGDKSFRSFMKD